MHFERVLQLSGAFGFGDHRKRVVELHEFGLGNAIFIGPIGQSLGACQIEFFGMNGAKHQGMVRLDLAQGFEHVVHSLLGLKVVSEPHRYALDLQVFWRTLDPRLQARLKHIAMWTAVPKELDHLDFALGAFGGIALVQRHVIYALGKPIGRSLRVGEGTRDRRAHEGQGR